MDTVPSFITWLNHLDKNLRFTYTMSTQSITFLDVVFTSEEGKLVTSTYKKPTDKNNLLEFNSFHPRTLRENLPYGQFLRHRRNCTKLSDYRIQAKDLRKRLRERNYPIKIINKAQKRTRWQNRDSLLESHPREKETDKLVCVTTYNIASNLVKKIVMQNWKILNTGNIKWEKPMFAHRRVRTLRDNLVHTRPCFEKIQQPRTLWDHSP